MCARVCVNYRALNCIYIVRQRSRMNICFVIEEIRKEKSFRWSIRTPSLVHRQILGWETLSALSKLNSSITTNKVTKITPFIQARDIVIKPMLSLVPLLEGKRVRFIISQIEIKTLVENIVSNRLFSLCRSPRYHFHSWYIFSRLILANGLVNERKRC